MTKLSRTRSRPSSGRAYPEQRDLPRSLAAGGFLLIIVGIATLGLALFELVNALRGWVTLDRLLYWGVPPEEVGWPLGLLMVVLALVSIVTAFELLRNGARLPALLASLGWLALDALWYRAIGVPFALGAWLVPIPFLLWGTWGEARRLGVFPGDVVDSVEG